MNPNSSNVYGPDAKLDFTSVDFRGRKRWIAEVERFKQEIAGSEGKYEVDISRHKEGAIKVVVKELADGSLKSSMGNNLQPLVMNFEIPVDYPMSPPLVWVETPHLIGSRQSELSFGIFHGVPCLKELKIGGWTPIFNLSSTFVFVLNALTEHTVIDKSSNKARITRKAALDGSMQIARAHPDWISNHR